MVQDNIVVKFIVLHGHFTFLIILGDIILISPWALPLSYP